MKNQLKTIVECLIAQLGDNPTRSLAKRQYSKLQALLQQLNDIADEQNITQANIQSVNATISATALDRLLDAQVRLNDLKLQAAPLKEIANDLLKNYDNLTTPIQKHTLSQIRDSLENIGTQLDSVNGRIQAVQNQIIRDKDRIIQTLTSSPCNKFMNISGYVIGILGLIVGTVGTVYGAIAYHESGSC